MTQREVPAGRLLPGTAGRGLSDAEVRAQRGFGFNDIVSQARSGWRVVARDTARDPMLWFLLVTSGLFAVLGQIKEGLTLLAAMVPLLGMDAYLHRRTLVSTASLASRLASTARTLRDGRWTEIPSRDLVPGDLVEVRPGDYFPADGVIVGGSALQSDESTLTGESLPVRKAAIENEPAAAGLLQEIHWGTAGTRLLTGPARMRVVFIGGETRYGEIARTAAEGGHAGTPLQQAIASLVTVLLGAALLICLGLAAVRLWQGYGWLDALLSAVTLAVAALPEEFPVVYTFFLGLGVFRLAAKKALVRRAVAVENIGRTTCIVSDKTGTITAGTLVLAHALPADGFDADALLRVGRLAARADSGDPLDEALHAGAPGAAGVQLREFPFTEARRRETAVWRLRDGVQAFMKGAPETVFDSCSVPAATMEHWRQRVDELAGSGHKVIACASRTLAGDSETEPDRGYALAGLIAFEDPVREGVRDAVSACVAAGMRVIMVTGDHPATAAAVAREIGLGGTAPGVVDLSGERDAEGELQLADGVHVVARATPSQKLRLVQALQASGEVVAVTGDGVNDVPALRLADIGVAMGERGTRSAREVASVVLLDDNFRTIVEAVAEGRQLFLNLRLAFAYLLLVHLPLVTGAAAIPLMGLPLLFQPVHIVWLELVIHPTAMLAFQGVATRHAAAAARGRRRARFFSPRRWLAIAWLGGLSSVALVGSYLHALGADQDIGHARAMALTTLLLGSAAITAGLTGMRTAAASWAVVATVLSVLVLVQPAAIAALLHLRPLHGKDWIIAGGIALLTGLGARLLAASLEREAP